jgi:hypothetical protein
MTFGVDTFGRLGHAAETLVLDATEYDVAGTGGPIYVKWYASSQSYWWDGSKVGLGRGYRDSGYASASGIANWLSNTLSYTKGKNIEFLTLGPSDTDQPIDCEMFAWGSWSDWSDCADGQQIRTRTRAVKTPAANGGTACPTDLEETESRACTGDDADTDTDTDTDGTITSQTGNGTVVTTTTTTPTMPTWAIPAGITAVALVAIIALK